MNRILALLLVWAVQGCEPCAFVVGGHCQDRQHDEQQDEETGRSSRRPPQPTQPTNLWPAPRTRG